MSEFCISIMLMACFFFSTTAIVSISPHSLLCSAYAKLSFPVPHTHRSIDQSVSPRACIMSDVQSSHLTFRPATSINISGYVCHWVLLSFSQQSAHPSVRQSSVHRSTNQSIMLSSPRFPIDPSVTHSIDPCITQATVKSKTNNNLHLA